MENTGLLSYADLCVVDTFHYTVLNVTFFNFTTDLIRKVCKYWEAVKHIVADMSFPEFSFSLESSNFITGTKTVSCCSLSDRCPCLPDTQV